MLKKKRDREICTNYQNSLIVWSNLAAGQLANGQKPNDPPTHPLQLERQITFEDELIEFMDKETEDISKCVTFIK